MYGNKIDNLILLKENGINVPDFWINSPENIPDGLYAVRSSSNLEDGNDKSFAGQFQTFLDVPRDEVESKIKLCKESINNKNVIDYLKTNNISEELKMDVLIQKMVHPDVSGVIFTCNPLGILSEYVISVAKGQGENVVADKVNPSNYYCNISDNNYYFEGDELLTKEDVKQLLDISEKIKSILKEDFIDIEFAIEDGTIYILQARKITTINTSHPLIMDNSNIVESYPGISSPLTISFVENVYTSIFEHLSGRVLNSEALLEKYKHYSHAMVGSVNGRIYYKISNWYALIRFLPFSKKIIPVWQEMLGVKNKAYIGDDIKIPKRVLLRTKKNYFKELLKAPKNMTKLNKIFIEIQEYFYNNFKEDISNKDIIKLYKVVEEKVLKDWDITLVNDMYSFVFTAMAKKLLAKKGKDVNDYISGISNIESLKPITTLLNIAYEKDNLSYEEYNKRKDKFIKEYGDRNVEELKLESKTFRTNPELLDEKIEEYRQDITRLCELRQNLQRKIGIICEELSTMDNFILNRCMIGIKNREISRMNRTRIYGMVRGMVLKIADNFIKENIIDNKDDIFYLTLDEIFNIIEGTHLDAKSIILKRRQEYEGYKKLPACSRIIFEEKEFNKIIKNISSNNTLKLQNTYYGVPCSAGTVEGEVAIVDDINNIEKYKNKILVTRMTDPGWVFLIAPSKGIICEKGSLLSHTAIVSRELKIPFVTSLSNAVDIFKDGDIVSLNGTTGEIKILSSSR